MPIPKDLVGEQIRARGDFDGAERADRELGEKVDTERDAGLLDSLGVDAGQLTDQFHGQAPDAG